VAQLSEPALVELDEQKPGPPLSVGRAERSRGWLHLERLLLVAGTILLLVFLGARLYGSLSRRIELAAFDVARETRAAPALSTSVDQSLWSEGRIAKYTESLRLSFPPPLAVLRAPRLGIEVPVLAGTDDLTLNRAIGLIPGTAAPGESGNVVLAGHRDGFFRGLKDVAIGDRFELETLAGNRVYAVTSTTIVDPTDVSVLAPTPGPTLTLVTCYPFYFVGNAPQRFIVRAEPLQVAEAIDARRDR